MSDLYCVHLEQQPCVVTYVNEWSSFLVGTYTLMPDQIRYIEQNHRVGSLIRFAMTDYGKYEIEEKIECMNGGVFDLTVRGNEVHVAHANNAVSIYLYREDSNNRSIRRLTFKKQIRLSDDWSILLTSIDLCSISRNLESSDATYTAVGDSTARVTILADELRIGSEPVRVVDKACVSPSKPTLYEPVWQVRFIQPTRSELPNLETLFLVACCENQSWVVFSFNIKTQRLVMVKKFGDIDAGATCVCILRDFTSLKPRPDYHNQELSLILGSYDENVRRYNVEISTEPKNASKEVLVEAKLVEKVGVKGAGIWRILAIDNNLYMAGMYAGCYRASSVDIKSTLVSLTNCLPDRRFLGNLTREPALDYGIDISKPEGVTCVVDFNNKLCLFFK